MPERAPLNANLEGLESCGVMVGEYWTLSNTEIVSHETTSTTAQR